MTKTTTIEVDMARTDGSPFGTAPWYLLLEEYQEGDVKTRVRIRLCPNTLVYILGHLRQATQQMRDAVKSVEEELKP